MEEKVKVITELRRKYPINDLLKFSKLPRSAYYYYLKQSKKEDKYEITQSKGSSGILKIQLFKKF